jgi:hypothetical protein
VSKRSIQNTASDLIKNLGRSTAHYLFPNDIDFYFVAFELVDADDRTVQYFAFPVNPQSIIFQDSEITKVQRTLGGITTLKTTTFDPKTYTLQGEFGRNWKVIVNGSPFSFGALNFQNLGYDQFEFRIGSPELSVEVKSGYGCIKLMEKIIKSAKTLDTKNRPHKLFFYNTSLNHQYLVEPQDFTFSQNIQKNMIWQYSVRLNAIARLEDLRYRAGANLVNSLSISAINSVASSLNRKLNQTLNNII